MIFLRVYFLSPFKRPLLRSRVIDRTFKALQLGNLTNVQNCGETESLNTGFLDLKCSQPSPSVTISKTLKKSLWAKTTTGKIIFLVAMDHV